MATKAKKKATIETSARDRVRERAAEIADRLSSLELIAIAKAVGTTQQQLARDGLAPGVHEVDVAVWIRGAISVGEDTTKKATCSVLRKGTLALLFRHLGVHRDRIAEALPRVLEEAARLDQDAEAALLAEWPEIAEAMRVVDAVADSLPRIPVRGTIKAALKVERLERDPTR